MKYSDFFNSLGASAKFDAGGPIRRTNPLPIDSSSVIKSGDLDNYLSSATVYPGQIIAVYDEDTKKTSFFGVSLNDTTEEFEARPLGGGASSFNSVQKIILSNGDSGTDSDRTCAFKDAVIDEDSPLDKSKKLTYLESDASYILDPAWKNENKNLEVLRFRIELESGKEYHNITAPKDVAVVPKFVQDGTFYFRDSDLTLLLMGSVDGFGWPNISTFRSTLVFVSDDNQIVSNFWSGTKHVHRLSKVIYDYGESPANTIGNGVLEIYESEIHLYGGAGDFYPRPVLSTEAGQSGKIYLHNSSAIEIPDGLEAAIEIIICPENNNEEPIRWNSYQKGVRVYKSNLNVENGNVDGTISTVPDVGDAVGSGANKNDNAYGANIGRYLYSYGPYSILGGYDSINAGGRNLVLGDKLVVGIEPDFTKLTDAGKITYEANGGWTREIAVYGLNSDGMSGRRGNKDMACWNPGKFAYNAVFGLRNTVEAKGSLVAGIDNIVKSGVANFSNRGLLVAGYNNRCYTDAGSVFGENNYVGATKQNCHAWGTWLEVNGSRTGGNKPLNRSTEKFVVGKANIDREDTVFEVGAGTVVYPEGSTNVSQAIIDRRNAFEVCRDGTILTYDKSNNATAYCSERLLKKSSSRIDKKFYRTCETFSGDGQGLQVIEINVPEYPGFISGNVTLIDELSSDGIRINYYFSNEVGSQGFENVSLRDGSTLSFNYDSPSATFTISVSSKYFTDYSIDVFYDYITLEEVWDTVIDNHMEAEERYATHEDVVNAEQSAVAAAVDSAAENTSSVVDDAKAEFQGKIDLLGSSAYYDLSVVDGVLTITKK